MSEENSSITLYEKVENNIISVRGQKVLVDRDVASLYGVETKRVNEAVSNNPEKFPEGYKIELTEEEKKQLVENFDRFNSIKHSPYAPTAFTERGLYMLATILKSPLAVKATIAIIDTFARVREMTRTMEKLQNVADGGVQQQELLHKTGEILAEVVGENLSTSTTETEIELNFAAVKIKHKIIRNGK